MSELLDGNLFEKMRIILPEHRHLMENYEKEKEISKREHPIISEHQYAEFSKTISEAVLSQSEIQITLYKKGENEYVTGVPIVDHKLRVLTGAGLITIQTNRVIDVCML